MSCRLGAACQRLHQAMQNTPGSICRQGVRSELLEAQSCSMLVCAAAVTTQRTWSCCSQLVLPEECEEQVCAYAQPHVNNQMHVVGSYAQGHPRRLHFPQSVPSWGHRKLWQAGSQCAAASSVCTVQETCTGEDARLLGCCRQFTQAME